MRMARMALSGDMPFLRPTLAALAALVFLPTTALAHGGEASIVLLLPTGYYLAGAAIAVAASFILLAIVPAEWSERLGRARLRLGTVRDIPHAPVSLLAFLLLAVLVAAGFWGTRDPVENPLPATIWTIWWVAFTGLQAITGPLWPHLNPWTGPVWLMRKLSGPARAALPASVGYTIAILQFLAFAWFELVDLAPSDPDRLATAIILFWLFNLAGILIFGEKDWMERADPFSILFRLIGALSPIERTPAGDNRTTLHLGWPGRALVDAAALPLSGVLFVLLALSTVSFDGLSRTFLWLSAIGINPLEFPGRSAVVGSSTFGIFATFVGLAALFLGTVWLGCLLARETGRWREAAGRLIHSIVPIALAFQVAHYLTALLVDGQNAMRALSDPFATGLNLFGTAGWRTTTSFLNTLSGVTLIFDSQTIAITIGHVIGIVMAHLIALTVLPSPRKAVTSQVPLAALMVFYTAFGLWLLATPRI